MNTLKKLVGSIICLGSGFFVAAAITDLVTGSDKGTGVLVGLAVFFSGTFLAGARLYRSANGPQLPSHEEKMREIQTMRAARDAGGSIGAAQLATHLHIPFAAARDQLEQLRLQGACELIVSDTGVELYRFPDLALKPGDAAKARDLLEK